MTNIRARLIPLLVRLRNITLDSLYWPRSRAEFLDALKRVQTPKDAVDLIYTYKGHGFYRWLLPNKDRWELTQYAERVRALSPKTIVEIGTRDGGPTFVLIQASPALKQIISIDLPGGPFGGAYPPQRARLYELFTANRPSAQLDLILGDSHTTATRDKVSRLLQGEPIDLLSIDGDHTYDGMKADYTLFAPLVREGGMIMISDIRPNATNPTIQSYRLWAEIRQQEPQHTYEEIINEPFSGRYSIGLLTKHSG